jgi:hypothetical protein
VVRSARTYCAWTACSERAAEQRPHPVAKRTPPPRHLSSETHLPTAIARSMVCGDGGDVPGSAKQQLQAEGSWGGWAGAAAAACEGQLKLCVTPQPLCTLTPRTSPVTLTTTPRLRVVPGGRHRPAPEHICSG